MYQLVALYQLTPERVGRDAMATVVHLMMATGYDACAAVIRDAYAWTLPAVSCHSN
jgi:hypothetical protein